MTELEAIREVSKLIDNATNLIPKQLESNLPSTSLIPNIPDWHTYEHQIWQIGEKIRQIFNEHKKLRRDKQLLEKILTIALNRKAKRGRESFIMLLWYKHCQEYAQLLIEQIDDDFVRGHIIKGLNKMQASNFIEIVTNYKNDNNTWIRNEAKKYINKYDS